MVQTEEVTLLLRVPGWLCDGYCGQKEMNLKHKVSHAWPSASVADAIFKGRS